MGGQSPPCTYPPAIARPTNVYLDNPDNGYHPQEVFLGHDGFRRVRQCRDLRYPPHPMHALPDNPTNHMYPSHHVVLPHSQPAPVSQSHSVVQNGLDATSTTPSTQQFVTPRISGNLTNEIQANVTLRATEEQDTLRMLMHMRSSATSESDAAQSGPSVDAQSAPTNISTTSRNRHVRLAARYRTSDWPSIISTNTGNDALIHRAVVRHSDDITPPLQKRRKRCCQHHHC